jgi:endonuclease/exonuclease/phosphatase family metal-dependent hydrolase
MARLPHISPAIRSLNADVVAIQEVYEQKHVDRLLEELGDLYPHHARVDSGGCMKFHNGLMVISKWPIVSFELEPLRKVSWLESILATKSNLNVTVDTPMGRVMFVNMHTTAGGTADPEDPKADLERKDEIHQTLAKCASALGEGTQPIIIGDLNAGPHASETNYQQVLDDKRMNFKCLWKEHVGEAANNEKKDFTWDPSNILNKVGLHTLTPPINKPLSHTHHPHPAPPSISTLPSLSGTHPIS